MYSLSEHLGLWYATVERCSVRQSIEASGMTRHDASLLPTTEIVEYHFPDNIFTSTNTVLFQCFSEPGCASRTCRHPHSTSSCYTNSQQHDTIQYYTMQYSAMCGLRAEREEKRHEEVG